MAWSPDSTQLAFVDSTCGGFNALKIINADGTGERLLACIAAGLNESVDWSLDGTRIAVPNTIQGGLGISQYAPDGTPLESLGPAQLGGLNTTQQGAFRYSPDSTRLAYSNDAPAGKGISFINVDGTGRQDTITTTTPNHFWWQPGPAKLMPATLTLGPDPLVGGPRFRQQLSAVLKDTAGDILSRGAYGYCTGDGRFASANHLGQVRLSESSPGAGDRIPMVVTNGGVVSNVITALPQGTNPPVSINPKTWDFGNQSVATDSATAVFTLTNAGSAALNITDITVTGMNASDFTLDPVGSTCPIAGGTVNVGDSCGVNVFFTPGATGSRSAQVAVNDDAAGSPQIISLAGSGI